MIKKVIQLIRNAFLIIRMGKRLSMSPVQSVGIKSVFIADNKSHISLGKKTSFFGKVELSAVCGGEITIGENVFCNRNFLAVSRKKIVIEDNVMFGPNVCIYDHDHKFDSSGISKDQYKCASVVIGAGTVVKGTIPAHSIVTGNREIRIVPIEER